MKDAAGNKPAKLTEYEKKLRQNLNDGTFNKKYKTLKSRQKLSLAQKIELSQDRIKEWYEAFEGNVSVSFSGGKDSSVLLWLVRTLYPDVPAVFCNTGLEYPEIHNVVKQTKNVTIIRPKIPFHHVIRDYGWPLISKKTARGINVLKNPTDKNQNIWRLYDEGINRFGEKVNGFKVAKRWRFLVDAPFKVSDKCCQIMKKDPMYFYEKKTGRVTMVGMMADDSKTREKVYLQTGCNAFDLKHPRSMPMGFWTEQDVIKAIKRYDIPYASVYGNIQQIKSTGRYYFDGVGSTGCLFCVFGLHMETFPNRFQQLHETHPKQYEYIMHKLGLKDVLLFIQKHCPDRNITKKFNHEKYTPPAKQHDMFPFFCTA